MYMACNPAWLTEQTWNLKTKWDSIVCNDPRCLKKIGLFLNCQLKRFGRSSWLSTTEQEAAVCTAKMHFTTSPLRRSHSTVTTAWFHLQDYSLHTDQRGLKINNAINSWWWPVSVNFANLLLSPTPHCMPSPLVQYLLCPLWRWWPGASDQEADSYKCMNTHAESGIHKDLESYSRSDFQWDLKAPISYINIQWWGACNDNTTNYSNDNATKEIREFCIPLAGYLPGFAIFLAGLFLHSPLPASSL